ncbi:MAG: DUF418 domain-containing protein [Planctomycetes bacterium]|nr:DUF418 domain-containing protein [Planctomycetota bacterium]
MALDVLRGFALLGIVGANIILYDITTMAEIEPAYRELPVSDLGAPFMIFTLVFVINKMMAVFSMLFGTGVLLATDKAEANSSRGWQTYFRRNLLLLAIGLAHTWFWIGDILTLYAICALVLYFFRKQSPKVLVGAALLLWYWAPVTWLLFGWGPHGDEYFSRAFSMMLFGMGLYRLGIINGQKPAAWYRKRAVESLLLGLPFVSLAWFSDSNASAWNNFGVPAIAFGYVCGVMWICQTDSLLSLRQRLAAAGQMALTNYLAQTLLGVAFYQLLERVGITPNAMLLGLGMLAIWAIQLAWSPLWLRSFKYGPLEWAWRSATYGKRFPMAKKNY